MNRMTFLGASILLVAFAAVEGCGGSDTTGSGGTGAAGAAGGTGGTGGTGATGGTGGTGAGPVFPAPPALGTQIDRFGRPAINTALNHAFDPDMTTKNAAKDAWNADKDDSKWAMTYGAEVAKNLAVIDALDSTDAVSGCGNQLLAKYKPPAVVQADQYATLAGALANDKLYVNTMATSSSQYLAVEANATMILVNMDGGGRKLDFDVIDTSYSALAIGAIQGVGDGVPADADTKGTMFPYLATPH